MTMPGTPKGSTVAKSSQRCPAGRTRSGANRASGRCAAVLSSGRRCPNSALAGSRYCGLPLHQPHAKIGSDNVADHAGMVPRSKGFSRLIAIRPLLWRRDV